MKTFKFQNLNHGVKNRTAMLALVAAVGLSTLSSCNKDNDGFANPSLDLQNEVAVLNPSQGQTLNLTNVSKGTVYRDFNDVYHIANYNILQSIYDPNNPHQPNGYYYFDFDGNDNVKGNPANTNSQPNGNSWDVSFSGTGNADINANTASGVEIRFINSSFDSVTGSGSTIWSTATIASATFGHNRSIDLPPATPTPIVADDYLAAWPSHTIKGWWNYYFPTHTVLATTDITILVKVGSKYFKVGMGSVYENSNPAGTPYPTNFSHLHFKYKQI